MPSSVSSTSSENRQFTQGYARVAAESSHNIAPVNWVLPPGLSSKALGGIFKIDWVSRKDLSFNVTAHLYNRWNDGKPVKIGRDGQEIEPITGILSVAHVYNLSSSL